MIVLKFGGSSVENATAMSRVLDIVEDAARRDRVILVVSAIRGCTDTLLEIGRSEDPEHLLDNLQNRHLAIIRRLFTGPDRELAIVDCKNIFCEIRCIPKTIESFGEILSTRILARKLHCEGLKTVWLDSRDLVTTIPGSTEADTAISYPAIAKAVEDNPQAKVFVAPGFIARNPDGTVTTLGRGGSDYSASLYAAAVQAQDLQIWTDVPGIMTANPKDIPAARSIPQISYRAAFDMARYGAKVLYAPAVAPAREKGIAIRILNTFDPAHPGTVISAEGAPGLKGVTSLQTPGGNTLIALVSEGPENISKRVETTLRSAGIRPLGSPQADQEGNLTLTVRPAVARNAVAALHREFFEWRTPETLDVYIAGAGAVGTALKELIAASDPAVTGKVINLVEISSDRGFARRVAATARSRSIFVDCTDSETIWKDFPALFDAGINIVTSNRRSLAIPFVDYAALKASAAENGCFFRYDTTVGNALPILQAVSGGNSITGIEAVVSCTLNLLITSYHGSQGPSFADILRQAQQSGLTEPDPRTDLAGRDARRKLLILAREAGVPLEAGDVTIEPMLDRSFFEGSLEDFYRKLDAFEPQLARQEEELHGKGLRRRFVASLHRKGDSYSARISMQTVGIESPYYWIDGTQNVTVIHSSDAYPLVIKGSGEGARLAASGILKNILA